MLAYMGTFHDKAETSEAVPEPSTVALLGVGLIGIGFACRKISRNPVIYFVATISRGNKLSRSSCKLN
jgi:hypothetical protein